MENYFQELYINSTSRFGEITLRFTDEHVDQSRNFNTENMALNIIYYLKKSCKIFRIFSILLYDLQWFIFSFSVSTLSTLSD